MKNDNSIFLVNIGNTHSQFVRLENNEQWIIPTHEIIAGNFDFIKKNDRIFLASVVPAATEQIIIYAPFTTKLSWQIASKFVNFALVDPTTIGQDRLANAIAASCELKLPAMIIDCGTAITSEIIDSTKYFCGGSIIPGRTLMRKSLHDHTALLPLVPLCKKIPAAIGRNTSEAITVIDLYSIGGINILIDETKKLFNEKLNIYFTGGDKHFFYENCKEGELIEQNLTIRGLYHLALQQLNDL
ncbi:MAG: type III pantothenate kinase [Lentisphaeria bacterium]